jgi:decaprenyl-phosphate phosphoribosyltransferase
VSSQNAERPVPHEATAVEEPRRTRSLPGAIVSTARPRQWVKNLLVFGAPATGAVLTDLEAMGSVVAAFVAFCLAASGAYFFNDIVDEAGDRRHPTKRLRPIPSGEISHRTAMLVGGICVVLGLVVALLGGGLPLLGIVAAYVALTTSYVIVLRDVALLDLAAIAGGFLLRAVAGGVAAGVELSMWFLMVAGFGSLFLAAGKRRAEYVQLGDVRASHRASLHAYSEPYLRYVQYASSTVAIAAYAQWAFEGPTGGTTWSELSIIPFVIGVFRYALLLESGRGAAPEEVVLSDVPLLGMGAAWVILVGLGVYA